MTLARRSFLQLATGAAVLPGASRLASAQTYPARPITMIVPFAPGGPTSVLGRLVAERMGTAIGQPVVVENVGGADGSIGNVRAAHAKPDGYTIELGTTSTHVLNGAFYSAQYDVLKDFAPIVLLATSPNVLFAKKTMPGNDLAEMIAWLKANPGKASAATFATGIRLVTEVFQRETGTHFAIVPYRGSAPALQDLLAGQIDLSFDGALQLSQVRAGNIKAYAIASDSRSALAPNIPTFREMGLPSVSYVTWWGLFAPKGTPSDIIARLNRAAVEAMADTALRSQLADLGFEAVPRETQTPKALATLQKADAEKWLPLIKEFGIKAE
ncbi:MAG TPA: tripartite tricarboxylate transporter substrate binding protein [Xanthobacteraceae bacterium]|jgi:tripartite-type tricarboxylate transporter receptor subunit TctC